MKEDDLESKITIKNFLPTGGEVNVKAGNIVLGEYLLSNSGEIMVRGNLNSTKKTIISLLDTETIISLLDTELTILTEERAKQKLKSTAIGVGVGIFSLGLGVLAGFVHASKKFLLVEITNKSGLDILVEMRPKHYELIVQANFNNKVSPIQDETDLNDVTSLPANKCAESNQEVKGLLMTQVTDKDNGETQVTDEDDGEIKLWHWIVGGLFIYALLLNFIPIHIPSPQP